MGERTELKAEQLAEARHEIREWLDASQVTICLSHHLPSYRGVLDTALALIDAELQRRSDSAGKCGTCDGTELVFDKPERYGYSFCPSCTSLASRSDSAEGGGAGGGGELATTDGADGVRAPYLATALVSLPPLSTRLQPHRCAAGAPGTESAEHVPAPLGGALRGDHQLSGGGRTAAGVDRPRGEPREPPPAH